TTFTSPGTIAIPDFGAASPYPSALAVSGLTGTIQRLAVRLNSVTHSFTGDLDILLVGPGGQKVMLMSDAGGSSSVSGVSLTFRDGAGVLTAPVSTGTYSPVDQEPGEVLPAPAPAGPYVTSLAQFNGTNPNGTWRLYVADDGEGDVGSIGGWSLLVTTASADYLATSGQLVFPPGVTSRTVSVSVNGDTAVEGNETFAVNLSSVNGPASIADAQGIGTIVNDDRNLAPGAATLKSPLRRMGIRPTYEWNAVPSATSYLLWVDDVSGNRLKQWYTTAQAGCASGGACAVTPAIDLNVGAVNWWIRTWSSAGYGPWSAKGVFTAATEKFVVGLGRGGTGEFQLWSNGPALRQASLDLPWAPYNAVNGEVHPATGDVDGDGLDEIVVGLGIGGQGYFAVFDDAAHGFALLKWVQLPWPAYNSNNGTIWPAVGDIDGDGRGEIVAGLGEGGQGFYAVFGDSTQGYAFQSWQRVTWAAYNSGASGETHPAIVNVDGGAESEVVIGLGTGGRGWLEVVDDATADHAHLRWLRVGMGEYANGPGPTYPAGGDVDGDGLDEVVVGLGFGSHGWIEVFDDGNAGLEHKSWLQVTWPEYADTVGETHPAVGNIDGDAAHEILLGLGVYIGRGGYFEIRDDSASGHVSLGWRNIGRGDVYADGGSTFPAVGRLR
ncbi:MAG: proprotein convertase P-domain-containing protein, partial [Vicinamibacterales bacterium]